MRRPCTEVGVYPVRTGLQDGCLEIQIKHYDTVKANMHTVHLCSLIVSFDSGAGLNSSDGW